MNNKTFVLPFTETYNPETYNPKALLEHLKATMGLRNDAALARKLRVDPSVVCKTKTQGFNITVAMILRMHEISGIPVQTLREVGGMIPLEAPSTLLSTNLLRD